MVKKAAKKKGKYLGFDKLKEKISSSAKDAGAVAAAIGRKKYGNGKFQKAAAKGKSLRGAKPKG